MNAISAPSGAPTHHLKVWSDGSRIYVEIPGAKGKDPYITAYDFNLHGLEIVLGLLGLHRVDYDYLGIVPESYRKRWSGRGPEPKPTKYDAEAEKMLRVMGIIK